MNSRVGLFGGSFDPIHIGHLIAARALRESLQLEQVYLLPSNRPPHKDPKSLADSKHRAEMVRLAIEGEEGLAFDDFDLLRNGPCYTIDTVAHFRQRLPSTEIFWFIGADSLMDLPTWHRAGELIELCSVVTAARSGQKPIDKSILEKAFGQEKAEALLANVIHTPVIDISSTDIRRRIAGRQSIRFLVPEDVRQYIAKHRLYED